MTAITPARIGGWNTYYGLGWALLALATFLVFVQSSGAASLSFAAGVGFMAAGFWTRLFGRLEERLIDIQAAVLNSRPE